jgi:hypothetical protein
MNKNNLTLSYFLFNYENVKKKLEIMLKIEELNIRD